MGADVIVYSTTKHIDGQGRSLGGVVMGGKSFIEDTLAPFMRHTGPSLSPFNAWLMLKGLETLDLRLRAQSKAAAEVARFLEGEKAVEQTLYPGFKSHPQHELAKRQMADFGTVVTFTLKGGREAAFRFLNRLTIVDISNNLGDSKSLICHPATTTHHDDHASAAAGGGEDPARHHSGRGPALGRARGSRGSQGRSQAGAAGIVIEEGRALTRPALRVHPPTRLKEDVGARVSRVRGRSRRR
jgi:cystathionine beta-lyase/cystathionine gamma-synthase